MKYWLKVNKRKWYGHTTDKLVFFSDDANYMGKLVNLRIEITSPWSLQGKPIIRKGEEICERQKF